MAQGLPAFIPMTFEVGRRWAVMAACAGAALGVLNGLLATRAGVSSPKLLSQTPSSTPSTDSTMPLNQTGVSLPTMQDFVENVRYRRSTKLICDAATRNRLA